MCWLPVQQLGSFRKKVRNPVSFEIAAGNIPLEPAGRDFVTWRCLLGQGHPKNWLSGLGVIGLSLALVLLLVLGLELPRVPLCS